jgi:hypothetical protein
MTCEALTLPVEERWTHIHSAKVLIRDAPYAILHDGSHRKARVLLIKGELFNTDPQGVPYTALQYNSKGLHYDADGTLTNSFLSELLEQSKAELTTTWRDCEAFLFSRYVV